MVCSSRGTQRYARRFRGGGRLSVRPKAVSGRERSSPSGGISSDGRGESVASLGTRRPESTRPGNLGFDAGLPRWVSIHRWPWSAASAWKGRSGKAGAMQSKLTQGRLRTGRAAAATGISRQCLEPQGTSDAVPRCGGFAASVIDYITGARGLQEGMRTPFPVV
jgi:hypothetical protein